MDIKEYNYNLPINHLLKEDVPNIVMYDFETSSYYFYKPAFSFN